MQQYTVLVIDDEDSIRALYEAELMDEGYKVLSAPDSMTAFSIMDSEKVDLVVLDIKLKGESGLKILQDIHKANSRIPVILSTAYGSYKDDISSWLAEAYVVKSGSLDDLKEQVAKTLDKRYGGTA